MKAVVELSRQAEESPNIRWTVYFGCIWIWSRVNFKRYLWSMEEIADKFH